jgi:hypothetical protein
MTITKKEYLNVKKVLKENRLERVYDCFLGCVQKSGKSNLQANLGLLAGKSLAKMLDLVGNSDDYGVPELRIEVIERYELSILM